MRVFGGQYLQNHHCCGFKIDQSALSMSTTLVQLFYSGRYGFGRELWLLKCTLSFDTVFWNPTIEGLFPARHIRFSHIELSSQTSNKCSWKTVMHSFNVCKRLWTFNKRVKNIHVLAGMWLKLCTQDVNFCRQTLLTWFYWYNAQ